MGMGERATVLVVLLGLALAVTVGSPHTYAQILSNEPHETQISETPEEAYPKRELLFFEEIPIIISAAKREQPITESPSSISVITAAVVVVPC